MKPHACRRLYLLGLFAAIAGRAQLPVTEVRIRTDPADARVRPYENLVIQVLAYGETSEGEQRKKVRLQKAAARIRVKESGGGWLSKPFRYQGPDPEPFWEASGSRLRAILEKATSDFVLQDAVLYTAPERPGKYTVEVELEGKSAAVSIEVTRDAPSRRPAETTEFRPEPRTADPYRRLAEHYAPFIAQETWWQPKSDYLARFDFDADWRGDNNWDHAERGSSQAYVHYAAMETATHWFLIYNLFHPRDYSDKCVAGTCHENDNEGLILTIEKDGSPFGRLLVMETLAHNNVYSYAADRRVGSNAHGLDGEVEFRGSAPMVFVESGGHGIYGTADTRARFSARTEEFAGGTGVTYVYKGVAERPKHANDRNVGYDLLPIYEHWWLRSEQGEAGNPTFDAYYEYAPYGGRPRPPQGRISGAFLGRKFGENKAKPFWGWHDARTEKRRILAAGQWGLDPAYSVTRNLRLPGSVSLDYVFNPYLGIGARPAVQISQTAAIPRQEDAPGGAAAGGAEFKPKRSDSYDPEAKRGRFDLRFHVDGDVEFDVRGDAVTWRILSGRPPRDDGSEYSQPVPHAKFRSFTAEKKDGRGTVSLLEEPSPANDFRARLRISDPSGGEDRYHVRLEWEWSDRVAATAGAGGAGLAAQPPQPPSTAAETYTGWGQPSAGESGEVEFQGYVDGTAVFRIRGDRITAEAAGGQPFQLRQVRLSRPLPAALLRDIEVRKREGRGEVVLLEKPWEGNGYEAVIQVSDPMSGAGEYWVILQWRQ